MLFIMMGGWRGAAWPKRKLQGVLRPTGEFSLCIFHFYSHTQMDQVPHNPLPQELKEVITDFEVRCSCYLIFPLILTNCQTSVGAVEKLIEPLMQVPMKDIYDKISPLDQVRKENLKKMALSATE